MLLPAVTERDMETGTVNIHHYIRGATCIKNRSAHEHMLSCCPFPYRKCEDPADGDGDDKTCKEP